MQVVGAIIDVLGIGLLLWKFLKPAAKRVLGLGIPSAAGGAAGAKAAVTTAGALSKLPKWFVSLFEKGGKFYILRQIASFLRHSISAPVILAISFLLSAFCPTIFEKIFLIVGAIFAKLGLMFMKWSMGMVAGMDQNNTDELFTILGESAQSLPPCMVDVLGYLHAVEDLGMIVTTGVFIGFYNLIKHFYFKFI